jgi:hypothetical protein
LQAWGLLLQSSKLTPCDQQVSSSQRSKGYALLEMLVIVSLVAVQVLTITKFFESGKVRIITAV